MKPKNNSEGELSAVGRLPDRIEPSDLALLNDALAYLFQELGKATELYQSDANAGREGVIHSVETTINFLSLFAAVISSSLHASLGALHDALMSLNDGRVLPLLEPAKRTGRRRASAMRASLIGLVAFTVMRLMETGMQATAAHTTIARELKKSGIKPARGTRMITARTVRRWCEEVRTMLVGTVRPLKPMIV